MNRLYYSMGIVILSAGLVVGSVFINSKAFSYEDERTKILLSSGERALVLKEMRDFLESVEAITSGIAKKDMKEITTGAQKSGMAAVRGLPASLMGKLPNGFKILGKATHQEFDMIATEAQKMKKPHVILERLGSLLNKCTTCHAGYRLGIE